MTKKLYGFKVFSYLRTKKLERLWNNFYLKPAAQQSLLELSVLLSQSVQIMKKNLPSLSYIESAIDGIVERVTQLAGNHNSTPRNIFSLINQVMYEDMGFHLSRFDVVIDKVSCFGAPLFTLFMVNIFI